MVYIDLVMNLFGVDGMQWYCGIEMVVYGELWKGVWLIVGVMYFDVMLQNMVGGMNDGYWLIGVLLFLFNVGVEYDVLMLCGFMLIVCWIYIGLQYLDVVNMMLIQVWDCFDFGVCYVMDVFGKKMMFCVIVCSVVNKLYWLLMIGGYLMQGDLCLVWLLMMMDF